MRVGALFFLLVSVAAGHAWDEPDSAREFINVGQEALEKNQLHTAAEAFQKAVDINPSSAKAHEGLGIGWREKLLPAIPDLLRIRISQTALRVIWSKPLSWSRQVHDR
jgi:hypothetical protein